MRVISQNERLDLPYENIVVEIMDSVINAEVPEDFAEQLKDLRSGFITIADHGDNVRVEPMNIVFRFPQEDEI